MGREKIKVPKKVYEELEALRREIHFTLNHEDTIKKAEDRGYLSAAGWIRENERDYKVGFSWGFEPMDNEPQAMLRDVPAPAAPVMRRTVSREVHTMEPRGTKSSSGKSTGAFTRFKNWLGKYF
jgi:hypothetical protein